MRAMSVADGPGAGEAAVGSRAPSALDVELVDLRALVAIADTGTFSAAVERTSRMQSAVSLQIGKLEERLEVRLLDRTSPLGAPDRRGRRQRRAGRRRGGGRERLRGG